MKCLLMLLFTTSLLLTGCSNLPESGINELFDGCTSQSKPQSGDLVAKKETVEMKGEVVVLHACLPPSREQPEKEIIPTALIFSALLFGKYPDETARFSVKQVLLGSYDESFVELSHRGGELPAPLWRPGEYVFFFKKHECVKTSIVKIGACDYGYVDAREQDPNDSAHICVEKVCKPYYEYIEASTSLVSDL